METMQHGQAVARVVAGKRKYRKKKRCFSSTKHTPARTKQHVFIQNPNHDQACMCAKPNQTKKRAVIHYYPSKETRQQVPLNSLDESCVFSLPSLLSPHLERLCVLVTRPPWPPFFLLRRGGLLLFRLADEQIFAQAAQFVLRHGPNHATTLAAAAPRPAGTPSSASLSSSSRRTAGP